VISIDSTGTPLFDALSLSAWACGTPPSATGGGTRTAAPGAPGTSPLIDALAGTKGELQKRVVDSQKECLKARFKEAPKAGSRRLRPAATGFR
jgi:hypothetical protein